MAKRSREAVKNLARAVRAASGTIDKRIMHAVVEHDGDMDKALKSAVTEEDVRAFMELGADPTSHAGSAAVLQAALHKRAGVIRELMQSGATADTDTVLAAVTKRHLPSVEALVTNGAPVNAHMAYVAASNGDIDIMSHVLPEPQVDQQDYDEASSVAAMYAAIKSDKPDVVEKLLTNYNVCVYPDMFIGASDKVFEHLLEYADITHEMLLAVIMQNDQRAATEMLNCDSLKDDPKAFGPALHAAMSVGNTDILNALLEADARVTIDVVIAANATHNAEIVQLIMEHGGAAFANAAAV